MRYTCGTVLLRENHHLVSLPYADSFFYIAFITGTEKQQYIPERKYIMFNLLAQLFLWNKIMYSISFQGKEACLYIYNYII